MEFDENSYQSPGFSSSLGKKTETKKKKKKKGKKKQLQCSNDFFYPTLYDTSLAKNTECLQ
jgi:hypothetical protein